VDADHAAPYTRVQISAPDAPGLLHCISSVIASHGCDVALALITTEGDTAVDVLHVTKAAGTLGSKDRAALRQSLLNALTAAAPSGGRHIG
jgi:UTP:GlnB (protein PII) uridylyltransferase